MTGMESIMWYKLCILWPTVYNINYSAHVWWEQSSKEEKYILLIKDMALFQTQVTDDEDGLSVFLLMLSWHVQLKLNDLGWPYPKVSLFICGAST